MLFALLLTEFSLLGGPMQIGYEVMLDTTAGNEHFVDILLLCRFVAYGVVGQQRLADGDGRVQPLLCERLAEYLGPDELGTVVADIA